MKVTFIIPPVLDKTQDVDRCFGCNYGLYFLPLLPMLYVATLLKDEIEKVSIIDFAANKKTKDEFNNFAQKDNSDIYIFYSVFLSQKTDLLAREIIRRIKGNAKFIYTGPQPTFAPEIFLDTGDTFAIRGEPEFIVRDLVRAIKSKSDLDKITGLSYIQDSKIFHNPSAGFIDDIDQVPIPDRTLLDHRPYLNPKLHKLPHTAALTSRGCYGRCWYCVPNSLSYARELEYKKGYCKKPPPRLHSVRRVIEEFSDIADMGFKSVSIIDDEFLWDEKRTIEICEGIKNFKLEWSCLARPDKITKESANAMAGAGCSYVDLGTESFDQEILEAIKKDMSPEDTRRAVHILKDYGIAQEINILLGATPKETELTIKKTLMEAAKLDADYILFSIANPFPGTDFYDAAKKEGWLVHGEYRSVDPSKKSIIDYPHLSKEKLESYILRAYLSYYFNPRYLLRQLLRLRGFNDFKNKFSAAVQLIKRNFLK